jgi:3-deoxy-manno-octulosonate cytidylyltransferase (CMP-KDO synthetase)
MVTDIIIGLFILFAQRHRRKTMGEPLSQQSEPQPRTPSSRIFLAIPARLHSTRLFEKPLQDLCGKPLISRVTERALAFAKELERKPGIDKTRVIVATDDERIAQCIRDAGAHAAMTPAELPSGTDRIFAALEPLAPADQDLVVNIQGDEPFFSFQDVEGLIAKMLSNPEIPMGTIAFPRTSREHFFRSSVVKVVCDTNARAIYFTRSPAPWPRSSLGASGLEWMAPPAAESTIESFLHHLGVYAYRFHALRTFARQLPASRLEKLEGLEQLRAIEAGWHIAISIAQEEPFGIDTPEDLARAVEFLNTAKDTSP